MGLHTICHYPLPHGSFTQLTHEHEEHRAVFGALFERVGPSVFRGPHFRALRLQISPQGLLVLLVRTEVVMVVVVVAVVVVAVVVGLAATTASVAILVGQNI